MRKLLLLSFALLFTLLQHAAAQSKTLSGTVTDQATGQGLPGVSVLVKGTSVGTATGLDGSYNISVPDDGSELEFRYIGYETVTRTIGNESSINISLSVNNKQLSEVLVVGYGTQTKEEFTGSAASVSGDKLKDVPVQSFDQAMTGRAAGVNVAQPNGVLNNAPVIRIRGINSISLSSYPLVVVDGVPINTGDVSSNSAIANNALGDINPADIESIDVLKDAASTSIYGSRAAGGVLLITTKKGKSGKPKVTYDGWVGVTKAVRLPKLLNAEQFMEIKNEAVLNAKLLSGNAENDKVASALFFPTENEDGSILNTSWYDEVYRTALSHNHSLSISGGSESTTYYLSANVSDQEGFIKTNDFQRKSVRFNLDHKLTNWLRLNGSANYTNSFNSSPHTGSLSGNAFALTGLARLALITPPNVSPFNPDGSYNLSSSNSMGMGNNQVVSNFYNPRPLLDLNSYTSENDRIIGSFGADVRIMEGLNFKTSYALDRLSVENMTFQSPVHGGGFSSQGSASNVTSRLNNWNWTNTLSYQKTFLDNHSLSLLLGYDVQKFENSAWGATRMQSSDPFFNEYQGSFGAIAPSGVFMNERAYASAFSRLTYDFAKKYFFTVNFRRDGNSALGADKKYGNFGGVSGGWALSEEDFYRSSSISDIVSSIKLRGSWGRVGNGNLSNAFGSLVLYNSSLYGGAPTWTFEQAGNPELGWETSDQTNLGVDFALFNERIQLEATYFNNDVNGLILSAPQTPSKGIPGNQVLMNVGSMYNRGFEFAVSAPIVEGEKFSWNANFNYTTIKNEVTELAGGNADIVGTTSTAAETSNITRVGYSVGSLYGAKTDGVNPATGQRIFINKEGERVQYSHVVAPGGSRWTYLDGA